jgi:DNA-binding response OmpR family regulator
MQVMANLLSNAAKFSPEGSDVLIRVDRLGNHLRISVKDRGPGIPEAFRSRIFEKFAQADGSSARGHEGTGLGLSITRKLVEAMKGAIGFTSEAGKGSIFYVELPALMQEQEEAVCVQASATRQLKNRVLIVEDNQDNATLIKILLEQAGFGVDIAYSLAEARNKLDSHSYAAMTLDLTLPDGEGITLLREVRLRPSTHSLPIVVVSGKAEESKNALAGEAVALVDWLVKPIDEVQLVRALRHAVSHDGEGLPRILHVEDDLDMSLILREMLKDQVEIITAPTLKEARELLASQNFALIVLDLSLPDGSGMELLKTMNTLAVKSTPVLILSASEASAEVRAQVAGVLVKSRMSETRVVDTILSLIHKASSTKEAA